MNFKKLFWIKSVISGFVVLFFINLMDKIAKNNDYYKNLAIISFLVFFYITHNKSCLCNDTKKDC